MRAYLRFGRGPLRFYLPLFTTHRRRTVYKHPGCSIEHRRQDTALACARRITI